MNDKDLLVRRLKRLSKRYCKQAIYMSTISPKGRAMATALREVEKDLQKIIGKAGEKA